jgi:calcineurin-like phosphoesterase family protein
MDKLSRLIKPSTSRNETLMEHWNQTIAPGDTVYVEGDFGADEWKPFLNGKIELITK